MVYIAATLIFITSVITLYALILNKKNPLVLLFLIPALLTSSVYTGYSIYALQGTPIETGLPTDTPVEIVWMEPAKPDIRLLLRVDGNPEPTYYVIEYTEENVKELNKAIAQAKALGKEGVDGEFKQNTGGQEKGGTFNFVQKPRSFGPQKDTDKAPQQGSDLDNINSIDEEAQDRRDRREELERLGIDSGFATSPIIHMAP